MEIWVAREGQGYPCYQRDIMMMMTMLASGMKKVPIASGDYLVSFIGICRTSHQPKEYSTKPFLR